MIAVVGSLNLDLSVRVARRPAPGETVLGASWTQHPGGKGANQAVAAARAGGRVTMVGRVGDDPDGALLLDAVRGEGVEATHVRPTPATASGRALVTVDDAGENTIVVCPGANARLCAQDVTAASSALRAATVTLLQQEVPAEANQAAIEHSTGLVLYNPAPATPGVEPPAGVDVLIPNRVELAALAGAAVPRTPAQAQAVAKRLGFAGTLVVTLGGDGVLLLDGDGCQRIPAFPVTVVDTTAAGDTFCGALATALAEGKDLASAARWASAAAALSVCRVGAFPSLPRRDEIETLLEHG